MCPLLCNCFQNLENAARETRRNSRTNSDLENRIRTTEGCELFGALTGEVRHARTA
jgi:hypothetical protein